MPYHEKTEIDQAREKSLNLIDPEVAEGRSVTPFPGKICGKCMLCCKTTAVRALNKPAGKWCIHAKPGVGCSIYPDRPNECKTWYCLWMISDMGEELKPVNCDVVMYTEPMLNGWRLNVEVNSGNPHAWISPVVLNFLKEAAKKIEKMGQVHVHSLPYRYWVQATGEIYYWHVSEEDAEGNVHIAKLKHFQEPN